MASWNCSAELRAGPVARLTLAPKALRIAQALLKNL
jgi:hypothetical protein